jgi:hypothetical protein
MYNPRTNDNREYEVYNKHTGEVDKRYHTRRAAEKALNVKKEALDYSFRIRTIVL